MEFQDKILKCIDCGADFVFTAGEQLFFYDKQFKNEPKRCKSCKAKRVSVFGAPPPPGQSYRYTKVETQATCSGSMPRAAANRCRRSTPAMPPKLPAASCPGLAKWKMSRWRPDECVVVSGTMLIDLAVKKSNRNTTHQHATLAWHIRLFLS